MTSNKAGEGARNMCLFGGTAKKGGAKVAAKKEANILRNVKGIRQGKRLPEQFLERVCV